MTPTATASSSPAAPASWCWRNWSTPRRAARKIYGEIVGYGATSDGYDMVAPSGEGADALHAPGAGDRATTPIDYINPHAHLDAGRRREGDRGDPRRVRRGDKCPPISATKSLTGHSLGATGVQEAIYSLLMMNERLHLRERQYRGTRPGLRRHADRAQAHRQRQARHGAVELVRLRRHQRHAGLQARRRVIGDRMNDAAMAI